MTSIPNHLPVPITVRKIISGGQTGVDRGALDAAKDLNLERGGRCPRGRRAEDGVIPPKYPLVETVGAAYPERTRKNVQDSDASLVLTRGPLTPGSRLTISIARRIKRPSLHLDLLQESATATLQDWLALVRPTVLNVAGSRESGSLGIQVEAREFLCAALASTKEARFE